MSCLVEITEGNNQFNSVGNREERQFPFIPQQQFIEESSDMPYYHDNAYSQKGSNPAAPAFPFYNDARVRNMPTYSSLPHSNIYGTYVV